MKSHIDYNIHLETIKPTLTRKTLSCTLGMENYMVALMTKNKWKEVQRTITRTQTDDERISITFEGLDTDYQENDYINVLLYKNVKGYSHFFSLRVPDGFYTDTVDKFKVYHDTKKVNFEIQSFEDVAQ